MMLFRQFLLLITLLYTSHVCAQHKEKFEAALRSMECREGVYGIGVGKADITGPIAESAMMGYADFNQTANGLHTRLWARAFVLYDPCSRNLSAIVVADLGMIFGAVKQGVLNILQRESSETFFHNNLMLTATHTHSGPGGYAFFPLYNITTLGFSKQNYDAIVQGISLAILRAQRAITEGRISYGEQDLTGQTYNRSPAAYAANSEEAICAYESNTNNMMQLLKFENLQGQLIGSINWFAVHPVSLTLKNRLVSSDNKGLAAYYLEKQMGVTNQQENEFVGAFAQADAGDVSPYDPLRPPTTIEEDFQQLEHAARIQWEAAAALLQNSLSPIDGPIGIRHQFIDMDDYEVSSDFTGDGDQHLCSAALGLSFAAGTENGRPDIAIFDEGLISSEPHATCQQEKPILMQAGTLGLVSNIIPFQALRVGKLLILAAPGEMTTMSGRKLRAAIASQFDGHIIISGLSNEYSHYISTREEYGAQHYEGASTLYGPWTEAAYRQIFSGLADALVSERTLPAGPNPVDKSHLAIDIKPGVVFDTAPSGHEFGDMDTDARSEYRIPDTITVKFIGAHPKNDLKQNDSYLTVEMLKKDRFEPVYFDWDPNTTLRWERKSISQSVITIEWATKATDLPGSYRICHAGAAKNFWQVILPYRGCSRIFQLTK